MEVFGEASPRSEIPTEFYEHVPQNSDKERGRAQAVQQSEPLEVLIFGCLGGMIV
jgi:hypothetical protein